MSAVEELPGPLARAALPGAALRMAGTRIATALAPGDEGAPYDTRARAYDRLVGSRPYNRVMWGTRPADYRAFAAEAIGADDGPLLDVPCGTAAFTAAAYRSTSRECLLVDRSLGMLEIAGSRLSSPGGRPPAQVTLLQGDLFELPLREAHFGSILLSGALHLFEELAPVIDALAPLLSPGGRLFASGLVAATPIGSRYLKILHRAGEVAAPRSEDDLRGALEEARAGGLTWDRSGCMVFASFTIRESVATGGFR